jgi:hypothetical protein
MAFRLAEMNTAFVPVGLLAPIVAAAVASGFRITWSRVALFTLLPLGFFFYWANILRQHTELLPFMLLAVAIILVAIHARWPRLATGLLVMVLASHAISSFPWSPAVTGSHMPWPGTDYAGIPGRKATWAIADSLAVAHKRVLLFSRDASDYDNQIDELYQHNGDRDEGPILVARDRGPLNEMLIRRYPDRVPFIVEDRGPNQAAVFVPLRTP